LSISHPRRIFRPASVRVRLRTLGIGLLAVALAAGGVALIALPWHVEGSAAQRAAAGSEVLDAQPAQVAVVDAGTLRVRDHVVRLLGVDPPVRGATCRTSDGTGMDCGAVASNALAALVRETPVACRLNGHDDFGRSFAVCDASGRELNRAVIAAGWARADSARPALKRDEDAARTERRGLWAMAHEANW
jgi:endonuclease YncB( thermonuclease family)